MKKVRYIFITILLIFSYSQTEARAENQVDLQPATTVKSDENKANEQSSGSILAYPDLFIINNTTGESSGRIPGSYANLMRLSSQSKYTVVGATTSNATRARFDRFSTEAADGMSHYVEISHVAVYRGKDVDVRVNVENMLGTTTASRLEIYTPTQLTSANFLRLFFRGANNDVTIRYEFLDHATGEKIPYKGTWIIKRLNRHKNIILDTSSDHLKSLFALSNSAIQYATVNAFKTTEFSSTSGSTAVNNTANQMMFSFDAKEGYTRQIYSPNSTGRNHIFYEKEALAPFDVAHPSIMGQINEDYPKVNYKIVQDYPAQSKKEYYPKQFKMTVQLDRILKMDEVKFKVTNLQNEDVTNRFTATRNNETAEIYLELDERTLADESFVDNTYTIDIESEIDWAIPTENYVKEDGYFHIPASVKVTSDINNSPTQKSVAKTKYIKGFVTVQYVLEDEKTELLPSEAYEGEIGENYLFEPKKIPKYEYIRNNGNTAGIFEKELKIIQFIYREIPNKPPRLTFDQQATEPVENTGEDFKLSGQVSDEDSERITVYYTLDEGAPIEIAQFEQGEDDNKHFDYEAYILKEVLKDGKAHRVTLFAIDDDGDKSNTEVVSIQAFTGELKFISIPKEVTFGEEAYVSAKEQIYYVIAQTADLQVKDSRLNSKGWQLSAQLVQALTSTSGHIIEDAVRFDEEVLPLNEATVIFEQKESHDKPINVSKDWIKNEAGLNIVIPAGVATAETYTMEIIWTLENLPENEQ